MLFKLITVAVLVQTGMANFDIALPIIHTRIVKGNRARHGQFPWHAHLNIIDKRRRIFVCGGSLIAREWVLTAAHCTAHAFVIAIGLGIINTVTHDFVDRSKYFIAHEDYDPHTIKNDVALIKLSKPAPKTKLINQVALPSKDIAEQLVPGVTGTVCGFGRMNNFNNEKPIALLWMKVRIISNEQCKHIFGPTYVTNLVVCGVGVNPHQNICDGDSGGGLVINLNGTNYLLGVTSFGRADHCVGAPAGYQKVAMFLNWIKKKMEEHKK